MFSYRRLLTAAALAACVLSLLPSALARGTTAFAQAALAYEQVRLDLADDSIEGLARRAAVIERVAAALEADYSAQAAGVKPADADKVRPLIGRVKAAAQKLGGAKDLVAARAAFDELSQPMIGWRSAITGARPAVAYCPMVKKAWLQPQGTIGNPFDSSMPRCGEFLLK